MTKQVSSINENDGHGSKMQLKTLKKIYFTKENTTLKSLSEYPEILIQVTITMCKSVDLFETVIMVRIYINETINS